MTGRGRLLTIVALVALAAGGVLAWGRLRPRGPIKVGILHSLTGTMADSERPLVDATEMAIAEINAKGGVLGRPIEAVVADGRSDPEVFARQATRLITKDKVVAVFGCWTSGSRKTVKPIFEKYDNLLFYPLQYEGLEESPNIVYTGAAPNQQIIPALKWALGNLGRRFYLVGSDYVFPRAANAIIKDYVKRWRGQIVGEDYILSGSQDVAGVVQKIVKARPDVILNTINGDTNIAFFKALRAAGITPQKIPTMSFSIAEQELTALPRRDLAGDYAAWNYFQSIDSPRNHAFVRAFKARFGASRVTSDPIESAYVDVYLWAQAVEAAGTTNPDVIRRAVTERSFDAPEGMVYVDGGNRNTWRTVRIGRIQPDGQFAIVWSSGYPIRPEPFPPERTRAQWNAFLNHLYTSWGDRWFNPGPAAAPGR